MRPWRFVGSKARGEEWMRAPHVLHALVEYVVPGNAGTPVKKQIMVVTQGWLEHQIQSLKLTPSGGTHCLLPSILVLPDGRPDQIRKALEEAMNGPGVAHFGVMSSEA